MCANIIIVAMLNYKLNYNYRLLNLLSAAQSLKERADMTGTKLNLVVNPKENVMKLTFSFFPRVNKLASLKATD